MCPHGHVGPGAHVQLTLLLLLFDTARGDDFAGGQGYGQGDMPGWAGDRVLRLPCALGSVCKGIEAQNNVFSLFVFGTDTTKMSKI